MFFFKKWVNPGLFFVYFLSFQTNNTFLTTNQCEKWPSSIRRLDLNPRPFEHELPTTTRPGLPPNINNVRDLKQTVSNKSWIPL